MTVSVHSMGSSPLFRWAAVAVSTAAATHRQLQTAPITAVWRATAEATLEAPALRSTRKKNPPEPTPVPRLAGHERGGGRARVGYHEGAGQFGDNDTATLPLDRCSATGLILAAADTVRSWPRHVSPDRVYRAELSGGPDAFWGGVRESCDGRRCPRPRLGTVGANNRPGRSGGPHSPRASHNPPHPAAAGRGKGRPKADPVGTRSALPATKAVGTLIGVGSRSPTPGVGRRTSGMGGPQPARETAPSPPRRHRRPAASPHPVPKTLSPDHPRPLLPNTKAQVNCDIHQ